MSEASGKSATGGKPSFVRRALAAILWLPAFILRQVRRFAGAVFWLAGAAIFAIVVLNVIFHSPLNVAYRGLDPSSDACQATTDRDILARHGNDEGRVIEEAGAEWQKRLRCAVQTHEIGPYQPTDSYGAPAGPPLMLSYDFAFLEFQENGDPYILCTDAEYDAGHCDGTPAGVGEKPRRGQLEALVARLKPAPDGTQKNYVLAFIHGWRHNARIGDGNVADLRVYAAHAARFVVDRCHWGDERFCGMKVTAVFIGWRGARTDETRLQGLIAPIARGLCGDAPCFLKNLPGQLGTFGAALTLFDRKPVSESVAPAAFAGLQGVERAIGLQQAQRSEDEAPCEHAALAAPGGDCMARTPAERGHQARMIVFGHSLGGNMLATALKEPLIKAVELHKPGHAVVDPAEPKAPPRVIEPGDFLPPPLGNLVVLINPASEASKWTHMQRHVWRRIEMSLGDKARTGDLVDGHYFFREDQRPVVLSATAARDWPPGGLRPSDCLTFRKRVNAEPNAVDKSQASQDLGQNLREDNELRARAVDYDWATYDLFPAFRFDFRPVANSMERLAQRLSMQPGDDGCAPHPPDGWLAWTLHGLAAALRVAPFMNTDVEETHTIGNLDPPRPPQDRSSEFHFSGFPFGTTHELRGWDGQTSAVRKQKSVDGGEMEQTLDYTEVVTPGAACPVANHWLSEARRLKIASPTSGGFATFWDARLLRDHQPALRFRHGFQLAGLSAITRANDPFWNMRAFDNALAQHDGYMLSSFICAMQQLALDDITEIKPPPKPAGGAP